ncbi:signal transduction histidine kinase [Salipiger aestuarii]|uniref:histidine kinase n=1 Tax=Salipiger aestuarii TaxID=568098 RepID=A0A327YGZ7_9RHOB|nr:ATP-binding protein [Salipiger aestuarii]RAK20348.1 signal transduction histidine kinase [Salipiger aestuarii]
MTWAAYPSEDLDGQVDYSEVKRLDAPFQGRRLPLLVLLAICCALVALRGQPIAMLGWCVALILSMGLHHIALMRLPDRGDRQAGRGIVATQILTALICSALGLDLWIAGGTTERFLSLLLLVAAALNAMAVRSRGGLELRFELWLISIMVLLRIGWLWYGAPRAVDTWIISAGMLAMLVYFIHVTLELRYMREDLNARVATEQALARQRSMTQFTGGVAHDFNNLLTVVLGNMELARLSVADSERDELMCEAERAARRGAELTSRLLALSRNARLVPVSESPAEIMKPIPVLANRLLGPGHRLDICVAPDLPAVFADPTNLQAAILELITNARDAMPEGGRIMLKVGASPDALGQAVRFSLTDEGTGIPDNLSATVFEPYFTTKPRGQGAGLGLPMVRGFVEQSAGELRLERRPGGRGTRIRFDLPAMAQPGAADGVVQDAV